MKTWEPRNFRALAAVGTLRVGITRAPFKKRGFSTRPACGCAQAQPPSKILAAFLLLRHRFRWQPFDMGISVQQFEQMKARLNGKPARAGKVVAAVARRASREPQTILGIDPSLRGTGYGIIRTGKPQPVALAHGTIACPKDWERSRCLAKISQTLLDLLLEHGPDVCVVEGIFYAQNLKTAIIMGEARGAAMAAVAESGIEIYEIATRKVKQAIVGYGAAQKIAVAKMVQRMTGLAELPAPDAADALALALAHAQESGRYGLNAPKKI
jgi:crossover junction endodeoxyribonuclease RuvC